MPRPLVITLLLLVLCAAPLQAELAIDNAAHRTLEAQGMSWLQHTRALHPDAIAPFTSDGCSGGLSAGWELLAESSEPFRERYGDHPPWEACCVDHDRLYWLGETEHGYDLRHGADQDLRDCVRETGELQADELAETLGKQPEEIRRLFNQAAELMYVAVRLGGGPCTGMPWRWGYGWPQCRLPVPASRD